MKKNNEQMIQLHWPVDQHGYEYVEYTDELFITGTAEQIFGPITYIKGKGGPFSEYEPFTGVSAIHRELACLNEESSDLSEVLQFCNKYGLLDHERPTSRPPIETADGGVSYFRYRPSGERMPSHETLSLRYFWLIQSSIKEAVMALDRGDKDTAELLFNRVNIHVVAKINRGPSRRDQPILLYPRELKAAIWLLIEKEIFGDAEWRRCRNCQSWFSK